MKQKTKKTIELVNFLHHLINKKKLLKPNQSMVLAISGGQDSIILFFIFLQLKNQWNWSLSIIYCNHLWQKDSFYTMSHLFKLAYLLNIPIYLAVTLQKIFTEQKARNWRSLTFQRMTGFYLFSIVVLGHSKSDRVETGLFNLFRGSSTKGVSSLNWTKIVVKECFFKLSKTQLNQISNKNELTNTSFLFELFIFSLSENIKNFNKICYKITKNTSVETQLLKPIRSQIDIGKSRKDVFFKRKSPTLINKNNITNVMKKFLIYKIGVHFKCKFITKTTYPLFEKKRYQILKKKKKRILKNLLSTQHHIFAMNLMNTFVYTNTIRKEVKQKNNVKTETFLPKTKPNKNLNKNFCHVFVGPKQKYHFCYRGPFFVERKDAKFLSFFYKHEYTLVRPLLSISRFDLKKICNSWKIPLFPDQSNQKLKYQRNRIRKQILPTLRFFFNPQIDTTIFQFVEIINSEQEYLDFITARIVKEIQYKQETIIELETSFLAVLPIALRRKVMKQFLEKIMKKSLKFFDIEEVLQQVSISRSFIRQEDSFPINKKQNKKNIEFLQKQTFCRANKSETNLKKTLNKPKVFQGLSGFVDICLPNIFDGKKPQTAIQTFKNRGFVSNLYKKGGFKRKSIIQKDFLVNLINQKKVIHKEYTLIFFPKIGSIFLQSQRIFFIIKNY